MKNTYLHESQIFFCIQNKCFKSRILSQNANRHRPTYTKLPNVFHILIRLRICTRLYAIHPQFSSPVSMIPKSTYIHSALRTHKLVHITFCESFASCASVFVVVWVDGGGLLKYERKMASAELCSSSSSFMLPSQRGCNADVVVAMSFALFMTVTFFFDAKLLRRNGLRVAAALKRNIIGLLVVCC